jgi:hypothetical protein
MNIGGLTPPIMAVVFCAACTPNDPNARPQTGTPATPVAASATVPPQGFVCPPAGTTVARGNGSKVIYHGTKLQDPEVCVATLQTDAGSQDYGQILSLWGDSALAGGEIRTALRGLFPLAVGNSARFRATSPQGGIWENVYRVDGREQITTPAGTFNAWRIVLTQTGAEGNSFSGQLTTWRTDDLIMLKVQPRIIRGMASSSQSVWNQTWEAVSLARP